MIRELVYKLYKKYNLSDDEIKEIDSIIKPIYSHKEFKKRCTRDFPHHGDIVLGEHIIEDTIITYKLSKKKKANIRTALKISMMHDLYTEPWQNSKIKHSSFFYLHGFSHPIEAVINSINWYPDLFKDDYEILIDGIVHHMFPFPVLRFKNYNFNKIELNNYELINNINKKYIDYLIYSSNRGLKIGKISFAPSKYLEGKLMRKADKKATIKELNHIKDALAFITGKNNRLK